MFSRKPMLQLDRTYCTLQIFDFVRFEDVICSFHAAEELSEAIEANNTLALFVSLMLIFISDGNVVT